MTGDIHFSEDTTVKLSINKDYARKFEYNKKREEIEYLKNQDLSSSDASSEDEEADLLTNAVDYQIMNVIKKIKAKDPSIYEKDVCFFNDGHFKQSATKEKQEKAVKLKDIERQDILNKMETFDATNEVVEPLEGEEQVVTYNEEQDRLKSAFKDIDVPEDDFLIKKAEPMIIEDNTTQLESKEETTQDEWLMKYVLSKGWMDESTDLKYGPVATYSSIDPTNIESSTKLVQNGEEIELYEDKSEDELIVDQFEHESQYRFQEKGAELIKTYSREIPDSARRQSSTRKNARVVKQERKDLDKTRKTEQVKRLKNLKKDEIMEKVKQISHVSGVHEDDLLNKIDLETEFNADQWDKQMETLFDDSYYENEDSDKKITSKIDIDEYRPTKTSQMTFRQLVDEENEELKGKIDEYYKLDFEDIVGDMPVRFKYRQVEAEDFGMQASDILLADEKELNKAVGLKRIAPYKQEPYKVKKQRLFELRKHVDSKLSQIEDNKQRKYLKKWVKSKK